MNAEKASFLRTQLTLLLVITLAACSSAPPPGSGGSTDPSIPTAPSAPGGSIVSEPSAEEPSTSTGRLLVELRNHDAATYQIAWAQELDRIAWSARPASLGHFVVASTGAGTLLVTSACNFNGSWEIGPGSYRVVIEDGIATLASVPSIASSVELVLAEPCPHQGP